LTINFKYGKTWTTGELYIEVKIDEYIVRNYVEYFNEARLVALAISLYFSTILKANDNYSKGENDIKILILDDVFTGMDMGNRIPLLKILQEKFSEYQIIITSYDESWYKLAQFYLEKKQWKFIRIYSKEDNPLVIKSNIEDDKNDTYIKKAYHHFNHNDFPACANYQRKAFEEKIKELLPSNLLNHCKDNGTIKKNEKLITNFNHLLNYLKNSGFNTDVFEEFNLYSKLVLNPLSHDSAGSPIFRKEVNAVFKILEEFDKITITELKKVKEFDKITILIMVFSQTPC
jgi:hypothetical protein